MRKLARPDARLELFFVRLREDVRVAPFSPTILPPSSFIPILISFLRRTHRGEDRSTDYGKPV